MKIGDVAAHFVKYTILHTRKNIFENIDICSLNNLLQYYQRWNPDTMMDTYYLVGNYFQYDW